MPPDSSLPESTMAPHHQDCVVGLGSNLGDRRATLRSAVHACASLGCVDRVSALYATAPVGGPRQPEYLNAAILLRTDLDPPELLERLRHLEIAAGRERRERWGPRTLDLDILWIRGRAWIGATLSVPHPRLQERAFALVPLLDVAPDAEDPGGGVPYLQVLATLDRTGVRKVALPAEWARDNA
jgi:2-amino-4-hydroxy-6-hydroxymethyldihydropteridine diphosphokinase